MGRRRFSDMGILPEDLPSMSANPYESVLMAAEYGEVPKLDLHGNTKPEALHRLEQFLYEEQFADSEAVRIIHGKGQNILAPAVRQWLDQQVQFGTLVAGYRGSNRLEEQGAVVLVALAPIH